MPWPAPRRGRHAEEDHATYTARRDELSARTQTQTQREWSTTGVNKAKNNPIDNDKFVRRFRMESVALG